MLEQGTMLDGTYRIIQELGAGGGGIVYKAYHERLRTEVALKKIKENVKGHLDQRAEADILKKIKHTYLPRVYDFLEIGEDVYTVMDYIPGSSLAQVLASQKKIPQKLVLKWARQLCEALAYLHQQEPPIIHSDIKPANIMLNPKGDICLIDFNISLVFDKSFSTSLGISGGYSPPEQHRDAKNYRAFADTERIVTSDKRGEAATEIMDVGNTELMPKTYTEVMFEPCTEVMSESCTEIMPEMAEAAPDASEHQSSQTDSKVDTLIGGGITAGSDIYSLGATLYHLITGQRPSYDYDKIIPISKSGAAVSEGFAYIIEKAMSLEPAGRYKDGGEMLLDLQNIQLLDNRYKQFMREKKRQIMGTILLYVASAALFCTGAVMLHQERERAYYDAIETGGRAIAAYRFEEAETAIAAAADIYGKRVDTYTEKALLLYQSGEYEECTDYCKRAINNRLYQVKNEHDQLKEADLWFIAGNAYFETDDYANAKQCYENAVAGNQKNSEYYRDLAICMAKMGNVAEAEKTLDSAIKQGLLEDSIYVVQGEIAFAKDNYSDAEQFFRRAIQTAQSEELKIRAYQLCAKAYRNLGNDYLGKEITILEEAKIQSPNRQMNLTEMLGDAYVRAAKAGGGNADYQKALDCFQSLLDGGYITYQTMENKAVVQQQMGNLSAAENTLLDLIKKYPQDYRGYKRLAFLEADKQQYKQNSSRGYHRMQSYYDSAVNYYKRMPDRRRTDAEMQMLDRMMSEIRQGGWL